MVYNSLQSEKLFWRWVEQRYKMIVKTDRGFEAEQSKKRFEIKNQYTNSFWLMKIETEFYSCSK